MTLAPPQSRAFVQRSLLAVLVLLAFAGTSRAQPQTFVLFESEGGDYIGQGQQHTFTAVTVSRLGEGVSVGAGGYGYRFQAPARESFVPGAYEGATRYL
jgi:hypothetical protein